VSIFGLGGRTALVSGASQGIGRTIAAVLAKQGARVVVAARNEEKLAALVAEIEAAGGSARALALDLARAGELGERLKSLPEEWRDVEILVNNAGITADGLLARMSLEQWQSVLDTNLTGTFALTREMVRGMIRKRWGRVITISSVVGLMGNAGSPSRWLASSRAAGSRPMPWRPDSSRRR